MSERGKGYLVMVEVNKKADRRVGSRVMRGGEGEGIVGRAVAG